MTKCESKPRWKEVAEFLEAMTQRPTGEQTRVALALELELPDSVPAPVAAAILRQAMSASLLEPQATAADIPEALDELEDQLGLLGSSRTQLLIHNRDEVRGWFKTRFMMLTARGLRELQPAVGDIVKFKSGASEHRMISSIGDNGRVYFRGRPPGGAWPNYLEAVARVGEPSHAASAKAADAFLRNSRNVTTSDLTKFAMLDQYALKTTVPSPESIRVLENLLESGEQTEPPLQRLLTQHPELLASVVIGGWRTWVIPQKRLGAEYVPDFLVLGLNSSGPQWVAVEIEAARHTIENRDGSLSTPTRHAVQQINDWREWLTTNVAYAQGTLGLFGITNRAPGLVLIGRSTPSAVRQPARSRSQEEANITIHSWDWLVRQARSLLANPLATSDFAESNTPQALSARTARSAQTVGFDDIEGDELDLDYLLSLE